MKRVFLLLSMTVIVLSVVGCGGKSGNSAKKISVNLTLSELRQLQQSKDFTEVSTFLTSKGWSLYEANVPAKSDEPYGAYTRLPLAHQRSEWTFEKVPDKGIAKGWFRWLSLNSKSGESAISYDIRDKAHRDTIIAELIRDGYILIAGCGGDNSRYRNDIYEVSFQTQFSIGGADFIGISASNYWVLYMYNHKQIDPYVDPKAVRESIISQTKGSPTEDEGVIINGVKWATRNVDAPGTFTASPEMAGMFYQWNRKTGWRWDESLVNSDGGTTWNRGDTEGRKWAKANDPSPAGWRVPSEKELKKLLDTNKVTEVWTTFNHLQGKKFTDKTTGNSIFLPAAGIINDTGNGGCYPEDFGSYGLYWSNEITSHYPYNGGKVHSNVCYFYFGAQSSECGGWLRGKPNNGYSVRPVAE
jgi:hypothetical protein